MGLITEFEDLLCKIGEQEVDESAHVGNFTP